MLVMSVHKNILIFQFLVLCHLISAILHIWEQTCTVVADLRSAEDLFTELLVTCVYLLWKILQLFFEDGTCFSLLPIQDILSWNQKLLQTETLANCKYQPFWHSIKPSWITKFSDLNILWHYSNKILQLCWSINIGI